MRKIWLPLGLAAAGVLSAAQPVLTTLYSFTDTYAVSQNPGPYPLTIGPGGVLYGVTYLGGTDDDGTIYSLTPPSEPGGSWTQAIIYTFTGTGDGANPFGQLVLTMNAGGQIVLYGTTEFEGGSIFSLTEPESAGAPWVLSTLYSFNAKIAGGPAGVVMGPGGVLYGVTSSGGTGLCGTNEAPGCGTVYSLTPPSSPGGSWTYTLLHTFSGDDGSLPGAALVIGPGGVLYGTTEHGGTVDVNSCEVRSYGVVTVGCGTVFSMTPPASAGGAWSFNTLLNFDGTTDGKEPLSLVLGANGALCGSASNEVYSLTPPAAPGGDWTATVIEDFATAPGKTGSGPQNLVMASNGVIYGVTGAGGKYSGGTVFLLKPPSSSAGSWSFGSLFSFNPASMGYEPLGVTIGTANKQTVLYGTTQAGPASLGIYGTVFSLQL